MGPQVKSHWAPKTSGTRKASVNGTLRWPCGPMELARAPREKVALGPPKCVMHVEVSWSQNVSSVTTSTRGYKNRWGSFEYHTIRSFEPPGAQIWSQWSKEQADLIDGPIKSDLNTKASQAKRGSLRPVEGPHLLSGELFRSTEGSLGSMAYKLLPMSLRLSTFLA